MLRSTFSHLTGIGRVGEAQLWARGVVSWEEFLARGASERFPVAARTRIERELAASQAALAEGDVGYFARRLPDGEAWRLYPEFRARTAFLDIETTSLSPYEGIVTVVAVHGAGATRTFVADDNLEELPAYLGRFGVLATFNGIFFDVPFLKVRFPQWSPPPGHIDLRFVLRRLGYVGGLKKIEQQLHVGDRSGVEGIYGLEAVRLWEQWRRGSREALDRLIRYNRADTVNLEPMLDFAVRELRGRLVPSAPAVGPRAARTVAQRTLPIGGAG